MATGVHVQYMHSMAQCCILFGALRVSTRRPATPREMGGGRFRGFKSDATAQCPLIRHSARLRSAPLRSPGFAPPLCSCRAFHLHCAVLSVLWARERLQRRAVLPIRAEDRNDRREAVRSAIRSDGMRAALQGFREMAFRQHLCLCSRCYARVESGANGEEPLTRLGGRPVRRRPPVPSRPSDTRDETERMHSVAVANESSSSGVQIT